MLRRTFLARGAAAFVAGSLAGCSGTRPGDVMSRDATAGAGMAGDPNLDTIATSNEVPFDSASFAAARRYSRTNYGDIAYVERGRGPAALFLHGFPLNGYQWRGALERLSPLRRCIAPDFLGLGYTEVADGQSVAPTAQVAMLIALLDHLRIDIVDVVASDSGGAVAQLLAVQHRDRVRTLLLTNCDVEPDSPPAAVVPVIEAARRGRFALDTFPPQLADKAFARSPRGIGGLCYTHAHNPDDTAIDYYFAPLVATPRRVRLTDAYAIGLDPNPLAGIESKLRRCDVPTRIVWGTGDTIFAAASPDYLDRVLPASRGVRRIEAARLFFPEEFPDVIAEECRALWQA